MKIQKTLLTCCIAFLSMFGQAQTSLTTLHHQYPNSAALCDSISIDISPAGYDTTNTADINIFFTGSNLLSANYTATITWADNSTTTHTGSSVSNSTAIVWTPSISNSISAIGMDTVNIVLVENVSSDSLVKNIIYASNACNKIYVTGNTDCDGNGTIDSAAYIDQPYLFSATDTIYPIYRSDDSSFFFPDTLTGTYTVGYSGYYLPTIVSISPDTIAFPIVGTTPHVEILFTCEFQTCFSGTAFCDDNNNGLYDTLVESVIPNMPIGNATTDSNGFFTSTIGNSYPFTYGYSLSIPNNWLASNGYYFPSSYIVIDTLDLDSACLSNTPILIPIHCNLTAIDSVCFDGYLFEDVNANGILDTSETVFQNVPININIDGVSQYIYTDSLGYFSYTGVHVGGANSISLQVYSLWLSNNNLTHYGPITILSYNCDSSHTTNIALSDPSFNSITSIISVLPNSYLVCDTLTLAISAEGLDSTVNEDVNIYFTGTGLLNETYSLQIDWGDNTTSTHTGTATIANQAINWSPALAHSYAADSVYNIYLTLTKTSNQHTKQKLITNLHSGLCPDYALKLINAVDCDNDGSIDNYISIVSQPISNPWFYAIPFDSIYLYNATDTIYADAYNSASQTLLWPSTMPSGSYSLGFPQSMLTNYDLIQIGSTPSITMPNNVQVQTVTSTFNCNVNQICINGNVFCDDNGNGILDPTENTVQNAPLNLNGYINFSNFVNSSDTTDLNGSYSFPATVFDSAGFNLSIDQTWLTNNGYIAANTNFYFNFPSYNGTDSIFDCSIEFNIPLICNATASDSICVTGQLFCDDNNDGILDSNEIIIPNAPVLITLLNGGGAYSAFTDSLGYYSYHNYHPGNDTVEITVNAFWLANQGYSPLSPVVATNLDCSAVTNIPVDCNIPVPCDNTWINIFGSGPYYQNWTNTMALTFGNSDYLFPGSIYTISIVIPSGSSLDTSSFSVSGYTINGDTLSWDQTISGFDSLLINFNTDAGIPDSTLHTYQAFISGPNLDCDSANNVIGYTAVVGASYDPNNKLVNLPVNINPDIQETLYYTINFQNTGTAPAQDVFIEDQLSQYLDWTSLEILSKSHNMFYSLDATGMLIFTFPQIWLPDSTTNEPLSKGYVSFKIKESSAVPVNQPIENTAHIFFDLNPAIITNTTINTNTIGLGLPSYNQNAQISVFPNPTSGLFNVSSSSKMTAITIFDLSGKLVYNSSKVKNFTTIDLSELSKGLYQLKIQTENSTNFEKLILR